MQTLGWNYRLTDLNCALGLSQMRRLDAFVRRRREIAALYRELLADVRGLTLPPAHEGHAYHLFPIQAGLLDVGWQVLFRRPRHRILQSS